MATPNIKKDANGNYIIVGFEPKKFTQQQLDYVDIQQQAEVLNGPQGDELRKTISSNPDLSAGFVSGLYKSGAIGSSDLANAFTEIDKQTKAEREKQAVLKAQEEANANFKKSLFGIPYNLWKTIKGTTRVGFATAFAPVEALVNTLGNIVGSTQTGAKGDAVWEGIDQTYAVQAIKQFVEEGKVDLGEGFFANEESGVGFRVREEKLKFGKIKVLDGEGNQVEDKDGNPLYRPYSPIDPISYFMTGGDLESGTARLINAIGEIGLMIYSDPLTKVSKARKAYNQIKKSEAYAKGKASAKDLQRLTILETQLANEADDVAKALEDLGLVERAVNAGVPVADSELIKFQQAYNTAVANKTKLSEEYQKLQKGIDYKAIEDFVNGRSVKPILDEIAQIDDPVRLMDITKRNGRPGFTYTQASALAGAKTREEVMGVLASYIADGQLVQNVLESGTAVSRGMSKIYRGAVGKPAQAVVGWSAKSIKKLPHIEKVYNDLSFRWNNYIPKQGTLIHYNDKDALAETVINFGRALKVNEATLRNLVNGIVANPDPKVSAYQASTKVFDEVFKANAAAFEKAGIPTNRLQELTTLFKKEADEQSKYWANIHRNNSEINFVTANGQKYVYNGPHLESERLNSMIYFPPPVELMKEISKLGRFGVGNVFRGKYSGAVVDKVDLFTSNYWKRVVLTRPAYIIRNIGEEQIRMFLSGNISFYNNPLAAIAMAVGKDNGPAWRRLLNSQDKFKHNVFGKDIKSSPADEITNESLAVQAKYSYGKLMDDTNQLSRGEVNKFAVADGYELVLFGDNRWYAGLANEIRKLGLDNNARLVASTKPGGEQQAVLRLLSGEFPGWDRFLAGIKNPETRDFLRTPEGAMAYLFTGVDDTGRAVSLRARIEQAAGQDGPAAETIKQLIAKGSVETAGYTIKIPKPTDEAINSIKNSDQMRANKKAIKDVNTEFADELKKVFNGQGNWDNVPFLVPKTTLINNKVLNQLTGLSDKFFDISVKFEKVFAMGPEWRQKYWEAVTDVIYAADSAALSSLRSSAPKSLNPLLSADGKKKIGLDHVFWGQSKKAKGNGTMTLDEIHQYAEMVASKHVKELFYDASRKRLLWHQLRLLAPFGQAWENVLTKWSELAFNRPIQVYKVARGIEFLNSPKSSALYEITDAKSYYDPNQGFFFNNPQSGERQFFIPFVASGMNFLTNLARGQISTSGPQGAKGSPQSFNFALGSGIFPGFGPGVTLPISTIGTAGVDVLSPLPFGARTKVEQFLFPYGRPNLKTAKGVVESLTTNNIARIVSGGLGWEEGYAASFGPVMNYLASGGDYNIDTVEDQNRLMKDSDRFAKWFAISRGLFGMVSPVAISPEDLVKDKSGNTLLAAALYNDFRELENAAGGDKQKAYGDFLDLYGPEQVFALIGTWTGKDGAFAPPDNLLTYKLLIENPGIEKEYADIYGYLYPNGGLSMQLRKWNEISGKSVRLTTQQIIDRATQIRYSAAKDRLLTRSVAEGWSSKYTDTALSNLRDSFVTIGLKQDSFDFTKEDRTLNQLRRVAQDKRFLNSEAVAGIRDYMALRDRVLEVNGKKPNDSLKTKGFEAQRTFLAEQALEIIKRNPDFQKIFYSFFKYELEVQ